MAYKGRFSQVRTSRRAEWEIETAILYVQAFMNWILFIHLYGPRLQNHHLRGVLDSSSERYNMKGI